MLLTLESRWQAMNSYLCILLVYINFVRYHFGKNGSGQNGILAKWYGQNGMDKAVPIKSSVKLSIPLPLTIRFFYQSRFLYNPFRFPLCVSHIFVTFGY